MNVQEAAEAKMEREAQVKKENEILIAGKTPLTSGSATVGAEIIVSARAFAVAYEKATITEVISLGKSSTVKFETASGKKNRLTARPVAEKNFQGVFQAYLA